MKTSTPTGITVRFGLAAIALGMVISSSSEANAQVSEVPPHRVEFTGPTALPKCNEYDAFYGILLNWVRVQSLDPSAKRKLVVNIQRRPDGGKIVKVGLLDVEGVEIHGETHRYSATEECFKVLYWTAFDAAKLLRTTIPPPEEEPPMSVAQLVEEAERSTPMPDKPVDPPKAAPIYDPEFYSEPKTPAQTCSIAEEPRLLRHLSFGLGATAGLTKLVMPAVRVGVGRLVGPVLVELDGRAYFPMFAANTNVGGGQTVSTRAQAYVGSAALCVPGDKLLGCVVAAGGVRGYIYDEPFRYDERYSRDRLMGVFDLGARMGVRFSLSRKFVLRLDAEALVPIYHGRGWAWEAKSEDRPIPRLSGFVSFEPNW